MKTLLTYILLLFTLGVQGQFIEPNKYLINGDTAYLGQKHQNFPRRIPTDLSNETGLVAAYNMSPSSQDTLTNIGGNSNTGIIYGTSSTPDGLYFDGVDDYVDCGNVSITYPFSVNCRIKPSERPINTAIISYSDASNSTVYFTLYIQTFNDLLSIQRRNTSAIITATSQTITYGHYYDITAIFQNDTTIIVYSNGEEVLNSNSETSVNIDINFDNLSIGRFRSSSPGWYFGGNIQDIRVYNKTLTEIDAISYHNSFADKPTYRNTFKYEGVGNKPLDMQINSGSFEIAESSEAYLDLKSGFKYVKSTSSGELSIILESSDTTVEATIYYGDCSGWYKYNGSLGYILNQDWLSIDGKKLSFNLSAGEKIGNILIKKGKITTQTNSVESEVLADSIPVLDLKPYLTLPDTIYLLIDHNYQIYDFQVAAKSIDESGLNVWYDCDIGEDWIYGYHFNEVVGDVGFHDLTVYASAGCDTIDTATTVIRLLEPLNMATAYDLVMVGNSLTAGSQIVNYVNDSLSGGNPTFHGTVSNNGVNHEGRGGYRYYDYLTGYRVDAGIGTNPFWNGSEFDFASYRSDTISVSNPLDFLIVQLGINDVIPSSRDTAWIDDTWLDYVQEFVDSAIADGTGHIILCMPPKCRSTDTPEGYWETYGQTQYIRKLQHVWLRLNEIYSGGRYANNVHVSSQGVFVDDHNNYDVTQGVHPNVEGYNQLGAILRATIEGIIKEDLE